MTLMCILVCSDIGLEIHEDVEQQFPNEQGMGLVEMRHCKCHLDFQKKVCKGDAVFVQTGTWHNVINMARIPLKVSVIYAHRIIRRERFTVRKKKRRVRIIK